MSHPWPAMIVAKAALALCCEVIPEVIKWSTPQHNLLQYDTKAVHVPLLCPHGGHIIPQVLRGTPQQLCTKSNGVHKYLNTLEYVIYNQCYIHLMASIF